MGMPVAAPGLRAHGIAEGLRAHGIDSTVLVDQKIVNRQKNLWVGSIPPATPRGAYVIDMRSLGKYLSNQKSAIAILINSNQIDHLQSIGKTDVILDFFSPQLLERLYRDEESYPAKDIDRLTKRKIKAIQLSNAFIINGRKKKPYFISWLLQSKVDLRNTRLEVVNMCVPLHFTDSDVDHGGLRFIIAGYLQGWSKPGKWTQVIKDQIERHGIELNLVLHKHWGGVPGRNEEFERLRILYESPQVKTHEMMTFMRFRELLSSMDLSIDIFDHTLEREYAMITRSVVALSCGVPVVHPKFTEVSPMIEAYDAGWLVDPANLEELVEVFDECASDPAILRKKAENARILAKTLIDPEEAVLPLVRIIEELNA
jgi:hypothetical protein